MKEISQPRYIIPCVAFDRPITPYLLQIVTDQKDHYATDMFTEETVHIIKNHNVSKPLFIYLAHQAVHTGNNDSPLQAPEELVEVKQGSFSFIFKRSGEKRVKHCTI